MAEPILYILAVCAEDQSLHGYLRHLPKLLLWYCQVNFHRCGALAKVNLSILHKSVPITFKEFELSGPEVEFLFELLFTAIYDQEDEHYTWIAYTTSNDSIYHLITFCLHLVANPSNATELLKTGILNCIDFLFQQCQQEILLKAALQLLTKLSAHTKASVEIKQTHTDMIVAIQQLLQKDTMKEDVFYNLLTLGIEVSKTSGQQLRS